MATPEKLLTRPEEVAIRFMYHAPQDNQPQLYAAIRREIERVAHFVNLNTPDSLEKSLALTKLEEAMFWANAAIARREIDTQRTERPVPPSIMPPDSVAGG